jgi:hypothetical protein
VAIDVKAGGRGKLIKDGFKVGHMLRDHANDDKGIADVLKNREMKVVYERVKEKPLTLGSKKH